MQIYQRLKAQLPAGSAHAGQQLARYKAEAAAGAIIRMLFTWLKDGATTPVATMLTYATSVLDTCCQA